jgi:hypothetical protein
MQSEMNSTRILATNLSQTTSMDILATDGLGHHIFLISTCDNIYGGYLKDNA